MLNLSFEQVFFGMLRTQTPENIGSAARALKVMGFNPASLIDPQCPPDDIRAHVLASHASPEVSLMPKLPSLPDFRAQVDLLVGFSARGQIGGLQSLALPQLPSLLAENPSAKVGLLFGPESTGLTNDDLSYCHYSCYIPTPEHTGYHSLNLAQAIQVVSYALSEKVAFVSSQKREQEQAALAQECYSYAFLERWLEKALSQPAFQAFTQRTTLAQTEKKARIMLQRLVQSQEDLDFVCGFIKAYEKGQMPS